MFKTFTTLLLLVFTQCSPVSSVTQSHKMPFAISENMNFESLETVETVMKKNHKDRWVIHFWATWCAPCIEELPKLMSAVTQNPDIGYILISVDKDKAVIKPFIEKMIKIEKGAKNLFFFVDLDEKYAQKLGTFQYPETYFFQTKNNKILNKWVGPQSWEKINFK